MAESGNSEAKKILGNLNSMSQEDLDSKLSTLFGKGGASKEGDTAPKDEKGGKAPEGKETAPKGKETSKLDKNGDLPKEVQEQKYGKKYVREFDEATEYKENLNKERKESLKEKGVFVDDKEFEEASKGTKEPKKGKVVANKDFDPNKEGVQSIFGTEEENAKSKDKKVFNTMEEVAKPKEMKSAKDGIKPLAPEQKINDKNENYLGRKDAMTIRGDDAAKEKELYDFVGSAEKEMPELSSYLAEFETYIDNDDILTMQGFAEYLDAQSENVEDTPEKNAEVRAVKAFVDKKLGRDTKTTVAPTQNTDAFGTSKEMGGGIGGGQKDLLGKRADLANPNRPDIQAEMEQEMEDQLSGTGTDFEDAEGLAQAFDVVKERYKNDPQRLAVVNKLEGKEKFRAAAKEYLEKNSGTSPLWAKAGMTGNQKQLDAKATYDAMFDFISDASTIEEAFAEARLYRDGENDKEFLDYLEQRVLGKDNKGSASNPMTSATEGIKPVNSGKTIEIKGYEPVKGGRYAETRKEIDLINDELELAIMSGNPYLAVDNVTKKLGNFISNEGNKYLEKLTKGWEVKDAEWVNPNYDRPKIKAERTK
jgi:hypothetical protein